MRIIKLFNIKIFMKEDEKMPRDNRGSIIMNTMDLIPEPHENARSISSVIKDKGKVVGYKLSDGQDITKEEAVNIAKAGGISGVGIAHRNGNEYIKTIPDESGQNNLDSLPTISLN